jgi:hypothetical protein
MGWPEWRGRFEIERLRRYGLVSANGNQELRAKREAVEFAIAAWRASREQASAPTPPRERRRRRPQWD